MNYSKFILRSSVIFMLMVSAYSSNSQETKTEDIPTVSAEFLLFLAEIEEFNDEWWGPMLFDEIVPSSSSEKNRVEVKSAEEKDKTQ